MIYLKRETQWRTELLLNVQVLKEPNNTECTINLDSIQRIYYDPLLLPSPCSEYVIEEKDFSFLI